MLQWGKQARRSLGSPHTKQSITQTCTAVLSDGKSTWQCMYLKAVLLLRNNYKEGILRDSEITTKIFFSSCTAQQQALAAGWALGFSWGSKGACATDGWHACIRTAGNMLSQTCQADGGNHSIVNYMKPWKQNVVTKSNWAHSEISWPLGIIPITISPFL